MKKIMIGFMILMICIPFAICTVKNVYVNENNDAFTSIVLEYGQTVTCKGTGGVIPYGFFESSCVYYGDGDSYQQDYIAKSSEDVCLAAVMDSNFWEGTIRFCVVNCTCNGASQCTKDTMSSDDHGVIIVSIPEPCPMEEMDPLCGEL